jgi:hypothetical protein
LVATRHLKILPRILQRAFRAPESSPNEGTRMSKWLTRTSSAYQHMNVVKHVHPIVQPQLEDCTLYLGITKVKPKMQIQKSSASLEPVFACIPVHNCQKIEHWKAGSWYYSILKQKLIFWIEETNTQVKHNSGKNI